MEDDKLFEKYKKEAEQEVKEILSKDTEEEVWKYIPNMNNKYQASSLGNIRTMPLVYKTALGNIVKIKHKLIKTKKDPRKGKGYLQATLVDLKGVCHMKGVHRWIMYAFHGESKLSVNHIDMVKTNNRLDNLEYMTIGDNIREAKTISKKDENDFTTDLIGSFLHKGRYCSTLRIEGVSYNTGSFNTAKEAHDSYMFYLNRYKNTGKLPDYKNLNQTSLHDGIDFHRVSQKWRARNNNSKYIGIFETESIALRVVLLVEFMERRWGKLTQKTIIKIRKKYAKDKRCKWRIKNLNTGEIFTNLAKLSVSLDINYSTLQSKVRKNRIDDLPIKIL